MAQPKYNFGEQPKYNFGEQPKYDLALKGNTQTNTGQANPFANLQNPDNPLSSANLNAPVVQPKPEIKAEPKVDAGNIGETKINLPREQEDTTDYNSKTAGAMSVLANGLAPDDSRNEFNTLTGERNPNFGKNPNAVKTGDTTKTNGTENLEKTFYETFKDKIKEGTLFGEAPERTDINQMREDAGVLEAQRQVNDWTAQLNAINAEAKVGQLKTIGQGRGIPQAILGGQQAQMERERAIRALPIAAQLSAAQGNLEAAQGYVTEALSLEKDYQTRLTDWNNKNIEAVWDIATAEEKQRLEEIKTRNDNEQADFERVSSLKEKMIMAAMDSGQPELISKLMSATTEDGVYSVASQIQMPVDELEQIKIEQARLDLSRDKEGNKIDTSGLTDTQINDPFIQGLLNSSGGKPMTDTSIQKIDKGLTVLGQLGLLQENVKDMKTGPVTGLFKGKNPWDTNAQTIKAQLNAIVPNLARGVYGEVGVLTDNDIKTYSQTLPNLTSTEDVRNAVLGITIDLIGKSIKRTLSVNAANGKDVSGFIDIYTEMEATRDSIFSQIPGYQENNGGELSSGISYSVESTTPLESGYTGSTSSGVGYTIE